MFMKSAIFFTCILMSSWGLAESSYDDQVLRDQPTLFLTLGSTYKIRWEPDLSRHGHKAFRFPQSSLPHTSLPNGDRANVLDGTSQYLEVASAPDLSVDATGILTIEAWIRPDTLQFPRSESEGYVHWAGKGQTGAQEYVLRMYSLSNQAQPPRPLRISSYAFNLSGGLGSGSYFQDPLTVGSWVHVAAVINTRTTSTTYPTGYVKIFRDGVLRQTTGLDQFNVHPQGGAAPLRIGTRDLNSFFKGGIGKFALYPYELSAAQLLKHVQIMRGQP